MRAKQTITKFLFEFVWWKIVTWKGNLHVSILHYQAQVQCAILTMAYYWPIMWLTKWPMITIHAAYCPRTLWSATFHFTTETISKRVLSEATPYFIIRLKLLCLGLIKKTVLYRYSTLLLKTKTSWFYLFFNAIFGVLVNP